ncbi:MAG: hypothetical protein IJS55_07150 [Oscillospiraceae bacterium]|nr:hypothetical protein [Oscillospiraceae bacterium]
MKLTVNGSAIRCLQRTIVTTGMAGAPVDFAFDEAWDAISGKTAVFRCGDVERQMVLDENGGAVIPAEVLHTPGRTLYIGVYGATDSGATWPAPTPFCDCGMVLLGAEVAEEAADITPTLAQQVLLAAETAQAIAQSVRDDADSGVFDGEDGADGADGEDGHGLIVMGLYATLAALQAAHPTAAVGDAYAVGTTVSNAIYVWDGSGWVNLGSLEGPQGPAGPQGPNVINAATATTFSGVLVGSGGSVTAQAVDSAPASGSAALVTSGGVAAALAGKQPVVRLGDAVFGTAWSESSGVYTQAVTVTGATVTANSRVDLQPSAAQRLVMQGWGVTALWVENNSGTLTAYALGAQPQAGGTIQCTVTEVTA